MSAHFKEQELDYNRQGLALAVTDRSLLCLTPDYAQQD